MQINVRPMGAYQTNCYLLEINGKTLIIDPGVGATDWVIKKAKNPIAILNTHGHFDHVWSNAELKKRLNIPIYIPKDDAFMLTKDPFNQGTPASTPDFLVQPDTKVDIEGIEVTFRHFPGHTPGCSVIEVGSIWFSGDFLFQNSIGRWDFPYSSAKDMANSIKKAMKIKKDYQLLPGHGAKSYLSKEQRSLPLWLREVQRS